MSTENFNQSPGKRPITFCRGQTHWLSKEEFESVKASGMFGEFYPDQPERWEDLPDPDAAPSPMASTAMAAAVELLPLEIRNHLNRLRLSWTTEENDAVNHVIARYFQPLLAKVEGERDALRIELQGATQNAKSENERAVEAHQFLMSLVQGFGIDFVGSTPPRLMKEVSASVTTLRADLAAAKEEREKVRKDVQFIQEIAYEVCRTDDDPHGDMLTIEGVARGVLAMPPDDGFEATPIRITAAQFTEMLRAYGWADNKESLQMFLHQLKADLAAKEAALEVAVDALKCARSVIGSEVRDSEFDGAKDCIKIALAGCLSALASRADKGGAANA